MIGNHNILEIYFIMIENHGIFLTQQKHLCVLVKMKIKYFKSKRNLIVDGYERYVSK